MKGDNKDEKIFYFIRMRKPRGKTVRSLQQALLKHLLGSHSPPTFFPCSRRLAGGCALPSGHARKPPTEVAFGGFVDTWKRCGA